MDVLTLKKLLDGTFPWEGFNASRGVSSAYVSDLLSLVMGNGKKDMAWITVQNHLNVIAVAALLEMSCVILPEGILLEPSALEKAKDENIPVIYTKLSAYDCCVKMGQALVEGAC